MRALIALLCACTCAMADVPPVPTGSSARVFSLDENGRVVADAISWPYPDGRGYAQAVWKVKGDGTLDRTFNGTGFAAIPVWGFYEGVGDLTVTSDGRVVVWGAATDPRYPGLVSPGCHPSECDNNLTLTTLRLDGTLDTSFNHSGRAVFALPPDRTVTRIAVVPNRIELYELDRLVGTLLQDGTLDPQVNTILKPAPYFDVGALWHVPGEGIAKLGLAIAQQPNSLFVALQGIDETGTPRWWVLPEASRVWKEGALAFRGPVYETRGEFLGGFGASPVIRQVSEASIVFTDRDHGRIDWTLDGDARSLAIVRRASVPAGCRWLDANGWTGLRDFNGFSSIAGTPGSSLFAVHDQTSALVTWFTYDPGGRPIWYEGALGFLYGDYDGPLRRNGVPAGHMIVEPYVGEGGDFSASVSQGAGTAGTGDRFISRFRADPLEASRCR